MQISFEALEQALAPIEDIGKGESTFDVGSSTVTLRILLPEDEVEVQKYAQQNQEPDSAGHAMEYVERFKIALLSYAIIGINDQDLRDTEFVETGEVLANGVKVRISRAQALRKLVLRWSAPVRMRVFRKYTELLSRVEKQAEAAIQFDPSDLEAEIDRLERRVVQLRELKEREKEAAESEVARIVKLVDGSQSQETANPPPQAPQAAPEPPEPPVRTAPAPNPVQAPRPKQTASAAPVRQSSIPGVNRSGVPAPQPQAAPQQPDPGQYAAGMDVPDSFVNPGDQDSLEAAVQAENLRLMQFRRGQVQEEVPSVLSTVRRRAPHLDAMEAAESLETQYIGRTADGVDAFRMTPPEEMTTTRQVRPVEERKANQTVNPRFQPPRKP